MRESFEPENNILKALFNDDVDTLQSIVSKGNFDINNFISSFELIDLDIFHSCKPRSLIDYSALYGSIKCFKYLLLNHAQIDNITFGYAIIGGNVEIIRTIDQQFEVDDYNYPYTQITNNLSSNSDNLFDDNLSDPIGLTIILHKYDLFDWIVDSKITSNSLSLEFLCRLAQLSVLTGNVHSLIFCIDNGLEISGSFISLQSLIQDASKNGYFTLIKFLLSYKNSYNYDSNFAYSCVIFGNISILKLFIQNENTINYQLLKIAIENNYNDIVQFLLDNDYYVTEEKEDTIDLFKLAIQSNSFDIFEIIENKYNLVSLKKQFNDSELDSLCLSSIKNHKIAFKLIDFIFNNYKNFDLTPFFFKSFDSGSEEICSYLLDNMKFVNLSEIIEQYHLLFAANASVSLNLLNKFNSELKDSLSQILFNESIRLKNRKVFDLFMKDNLDNKMLLIAAVKFSDFELVKKVLSYKNDPPFINQNFKEGTALAIATLNGDIEIVKYLLELPGIDANIVGFDGRTPLMIAITQLNIEMIGIFVDFYGDEIQSQSWQLRQSISIICSQYFSVTEKIEDDIIFVLNGLIQIDENLDLNEANILFYAIMKNSLKIVDFLLKINSIDVNRQKCGDTPLSLAVKCQNSQIVKLLINHPKIDINIAEFNTHTPFTIAVLNNMEEIVKLIMNHPKFDPESSNVDLAFFLSTNDSITNLCHSIKSLNVNYLINPLILKSKQSNENTELNYNSWMSNYNNHNYKPNYNKNWKIYGVNPTHYNTANTRTKATASLIDTSLTYAVKTNQLLKVNLIINHPSFDKTKSKIIQALFLSTNNIEIFKVLFKLVNDANIVSHEGKSLFEFLFGLKKTNLIKIIIKDSNLNLSKEDLLNYYKQTIGQLLNNNPSASEMLSCLIEYDQNHNHVIGISDSYQDALQKLISFSE